MSLFVGDLSSEVTDDILMTTFTSRFTTIRGAKVVTDPTTGQGRGYGFVRFGNKLEYEQALNSMGGVYCGSKPMRVSQATDRRKLQQQAAAATAVPLGYGQPVPPTQVAYGASVASYPYSAQQYQAYYGGGYYGMQQSPQATTVGYPQQYISNAYSGQTAYQTAYPQETAVAKVETVDFTKFDDPAEKNSEYVRLHARQVCDLFRNLINVIIVLRPVDNGIISRSFRSECCNRNCNGISITK